jgi:DNA-binding IclR family transcriptional regulator
MVRNDDTSMIEKAMLILEAFRAAREPLRLSDMVRQTHLPKATVHRLAREMTTLGMLFELGELVPIKHRLREAALPFMQDLYEATHETVHLGVRVDLDVLYAEKIRGHSGIDLPSRIGGRLPLTTTGVGKALLAFAPPEIVEQVQSRQLRQLTPYSITDHAQLHDELSAIRASRLAYDREEAQIGACCVAAPIVVRGEAVAALSVAVARQQFHPARLAPAVRATALALARKLDR